MAKKLLIITILLVTSFSLMAQWTCETIDPEFDDAYKVAYTQENNSGRLLIGEYRSLESYINFTSSETNLENHIFLYLRNQDDINWEEMEVLDWLEYTQQYLYRHIEDAGNIPILLNFSPVDAYYCNEDYCSVYSFDVSFKVGESHKQYKNTHNNYYTLIEERSVIPLKSDEIVVSYKYDRKNRLGSYYIEWPSKDFWKDFNAASSVKIRIKHNENSNYQYYEFNMNGSAKAFNFVTTNHTVYWLEDLAREFKKDFKDKVQLYKKELINEANMPNDIYTAYNNCLNLYLYNCYDEYVYDEYHNYCFLHDIDSNGIPELWIVVGSAECCKGLIAYSYDKSTRKAKKVFESSAGHASILIGDNYISRWMEHSGVCYLDKIFFNGKEIVEKRLFESEEVWDEDSEKWVEHVSLNIVKDNMPMENNKLIEPTAPDAVPLEDFDFLWEDDNE